MSIDAQTMTATLSDWLALDAVPDFPGAFNGVQLQPPERIAVVATAVDACAATARAAADANADLLLVHHGMLWDAPYRLVGHHYEQIATLIRAECGLYSVHLPLDAHPVLGNNAILGTKLGIETHEPFGAFRDAVIGLIGRPAADTAAKASDALGFAVEEAVPAPGDGVKRLAVVSGGAASMLREAAAAGADALLTGEAKHHDRVLARDLGIGLWLGGHYATETVGVRAVGEKLATEFGVEHVALDLPTGG